MEPRIRYEVWEERKGRKRPRNQAFATLPYPEPLLNVVREFNAEEAENARLERRSVEVRFFVARATTTFEEVPS